MKRKRVLLGVVALVASTVLITTEVVSARQDSKAQAPDAAAMQKMKDEMMAKMMELGTPGPEHAKIAEQVGKWTQTYKMKWDPTATTWDDATGTSETKMILDGRFLAGDYVVNMKEGPMKGFQLLGFDKAKGEYTSLWGDTYSTAWTTTSGKETAPGTVEMRGTMMMPTGESPTRSVVQHKSRDEYSFQMYVTYPGLGEVLVMDYTSKRVK